MPPLPLPRPPHVARVTLLVASALAFACGGGGKTAPAPPLGTLPYVPSERDGVAPGVLAQAAPAYDYDTTAWTEVVRLDPTVELDLRYATDSNFVDAVMYECPRCFLRPVAARALARVQDSLRENGLGLRLFDCYRPLGVQRRLWARVPDRRYVADPAQGSQHNRGQAVDLTFVSLATGEPLDMGTPYDHFGGEAWHRATVGFPEPVRANRTRILAVMEGLGWVRTDSEWWHYRWPGRAAIDSMEWACPPPILPTG